MGFWTDGENDRDWSEQTHGEPDELRDQFCRCKRCGAPFTKPNSYPEWAVRVCDACHRLIMATQDRKAGAA